MFTFLIISDFDRITDSVYQAFAAIGTPRSEPDKRFVVESSTGMEGGWIAFQPIEDVQYDYGMDELEEIKSRIKNPSFFWSKGVMVKINFQQSSYKSLALPIRC